MRIGSNEAQLFIRWLRASPYGCHEYSHCRRLSNLTQAHAIPLFPWIPGKKSVGRFHNFVFFDLNQLDLITNVQ